MRQILLFFIAAFVIASLVPRLFPNVKAPPAVTPAVADTRPAQKAPPGSRKISLYKSHNGHYQAQVDVNGINIGFLVDTGASMVALRESDAAKIGIRPTQDKYTALVATANGRVRGAPIKLKRVELGSISVEDVEGLVLPDSALSSNLLGMSFLSQVNWSQKGGNLVLEQ